MQAYQSSIHHFPLIRHWFLVIIFFIERKIVVIVMNKNDGNAEREDQCFLTLHQDFWHRKFALLQTHETSESVKKGDSLLARQPSWKFELIMGMNGVQEQISSTAYTCIDHYFKLRCKIGKIKHTEFDGCLVSEWSSTSSDDFIKRWMIYEILLLLVRHRPLSQTIKYLLVWDLLLFGLQYISYSHKFSWTDLWYFRTESRRGRNFFLVIIC